MKQIQSNTPQKEQIAIVLIGNKCDVDNREVTKEEGELLSKEYGLKYGPREEGGTVVTVYIPLQETLKQIDTL